MAGRIPQRCALHDRYDDCPDASTGVDCRVRKEAGEMSDEGYNGWKNYPTWCVNLWLENDRGTYEATLEIVREEYDDAPACLQVREGIWTVEQARRFNTADHLREWVEEMQPEGEASMFTDLLGYALGEVDWHEIAAAWLETLEELAVHEG